MGLCLLALGPLQEGCTAAGPYQKDSEYAPYFGDVPATFYDNDPALRHWFTAPYWHPVSGGE